MRRITTLLAALAFAGIATSATAGGIEGVLHWTCNGSEECETVWFTEPVLLDWSVDPSASGNCADVWIKDDTTGDPPQPCHVTKGSADINVSLKVRVDKKPPTISEVRPDRPADHAGWYTHPVSLSAMASDETSGLNRCGSVTYAGPDSADARVAVTCWDIAGNAASRVMPLRYDATPPDPRSATVTTGDRVVRLSWPAGADATVTRTPGKGGSSAVVYDGAGTGFTDREVRNGRRYRYVLTLSDEAGNSASRELSAVPDQRLLAPARSATVAGPPLLTWTPVRNARYYNVQVFREGRKILSAWPRRAALQLKSKWRFRGKQRRLRPGVYHWYVWPGKGRREARRYGKRIGKRSFTVAPRQ